MLCEASENTRGTGPRMEGFRAGGETSTAEAEESEMGSRHVRLVRSNSGWYSFHVADSASQEISQFIC